MLRRGLHPLQTPRVGVELRRGPKRKILWNLLWRCLVEVELQDANPLAQLDVFGAGGTNHSLTGIHASDLMPGYMLQQPLLAERSFERNMAFQCTVS